jgi:hypothetical protein
MTDMAPTVQTPYLVVDSPYEIANARPLYQWVLYIPHGIINWALDQLANIVFFVYWLALIFTGKLQPGLYNLMAMSERYGARTGGFLLGYSEEYPPFEFKVGPTDSDAYRPVTLSLPEVPTDVSRWVALNVIKAIPHYIVVAIFAIGALFLAIYGWFAVLFTGRWPAGARDWLVRFSNYYFRIWTYVAMVDNNYPKFGLPAA